MSRGRTTASVRATFGLARIMAKEVSIPEPQADSAQIPLLRIDSVVKKFGTYRAVDQLSLDVGAGEGTGLGSGENGQGNAKQESARGLMCHFHKFLRA